MSTPSRAYILLRANKTYACMNVIKDGTPSWEWEEITVVNFNGKLTAAEARVAVESDESVDTREERGTRDQKLSQLMDKAQSFVSLGKRKFRKVEGKMRLLRPLQVHSRTVSGRLNAAVKVESAWEQLDSTYVPEAGNTLGAFSTLLTECQVKYKAVFKEGAEESDVSGEVASLLEELYHLSVDWYQEAIRRFGPDTPHGMMIREEIPTQSGDTPLPEKAMLSASWDTDLSKVVLVFAALHASSFQVQRSDDGGATWNDYGAATSPAEFGDMGAGPYQYRVRGINSTGEGEWSDPADVTVP